MASVSSTWWYSLCLSILSPYSWNTGNSHIQIMVDNKKKHTNNKGEGKQFNVVAEVMIFFFFWLSEGYFSFSTTRKQDHEEGIHDGNLHYNILLPLLWILWICSIWKQYAWKSLDRVWVLWALLAHWLC